MFPQFPQFAGSAMVSVQIGPCGLGHIFDLSGGHVVVPPHIPLPQATPDGQAAPQLPQLAGSLLRLVQYCMPVAVMQPLGMLAGQPGAPPHIPFPHATPDGQVMPQPPQFAASAFGSVQYVPPPAIGQAIGAVGGQVVPPVPVHTPIWQATPAGQGLPHPPQFAGSCIGSVQKLLTPSGARHVIIGAVQVGGVPETHIAALQTIPDGQARPQPPQLAVSRERSVQ
jgi:hypothetical protein